MSEEVRYARKAVPRTLLLTNIVNGILAYGMVLTLLFTMGPVDDVLNSNHAIVQIIRQATGSNGAAIALMVALIMLGMTSLLANLASSARLTWAWSRDGGLPAWFSYVSIFIPFCNSTLLSSLIVVLSEGLA